MNTIRITKEFDFEMAHALFGYDGPCKNIHGHSYKLSVTIIGKPSEDTKSSKYGMLLDFKILKKIVKDCIIEIFDHALILNKNHPKELLSEIIKNFEKIIVADYQPTSENIIIDFSNRIKKNLPENIKLNSLKLHETATSFTEWYQKDNK
ncbi:MAG: 6-carboxytetrahydropterin synthase [Bacteroidales bacterium]|nr:6-carboxytetrahydropterin synthase [Bacteroidales bacterium]